MVLLGTIIGQIMTIYIRLEQTWLTIKKLCDLQVMGGVEELEARNYLSKKEKILIFRYFYQFSSFYYFFLRTMKCLTRAEIFFGDHQQLQQQFLGHG